MTLAVLLTYSIAGTAALIATHAVKKTFLKDAIWEILFPSGAGAQSGITLVSVTV